MVFKHFLLHQVFFFQWYLTWKLSVVNREKWGFSGCRGWKVLSLSVVPAGGPLVPKDCSVEATGLREVYWVGQKVLLGLSVGCNGKPPTNFLANSTRPLLLSEFISCKHADESYSQDSVSLACAKLLLIPLASSCPNSAGILRSESEMERNPEVPSSTRDEALLHYTTPSGVPSGPSQLHRIHDFSEAPC